MLQNPLKSLQFRAHPWLHTPVNSPSIDLIWSAQKHLLSQFNPQRFFLQPVHKTRTAAIPYVELKIYYMLYQSSKLSSLMIYVNLSGDPIGHHIGTNTTQRHTLGSTCIQYIVERFTLLYIMHATYLRKRKTLSYGGGQGLLVYTPIRI